MTAVYSFMAVLIGGYLWSVSPRVSERKRVWCAAGFFLFLTAFWFAQVELLGAPKPMSLEWVSRGDAKILASRVVEKKAIYLWVLVDGEREPRYYKIPWTQKVAGKLQKALREARQGLKMSIPYQKSWGKDSPFHPAPQPKLPEKMGAPPPRELKNPKYGV